MRFCTMNATFGKLERRSLSFAPGLNIIEAPNESGKSTLSAFLRVMLYGVATRERGTLADKNRYAPWSGAPMQGVLELESERFGAVTLQRDTPRPDLPMGRFSATRTGTGEVIPGLTAADCGEALLGIPRGVYERSAFIRQSGLAVDQDAELERRIAALMTTGEEDVSFTEAKAALKKQLNARRVGSRSGQLPALERAIDADAAVLEELRQLAGQRSADEAELAALQQEDASLRSQLRTHLLCDQEDRRQERIEATRAADEADAKAEIIYRMIADAKTPDRETLEQKKSALHALDGVIDRRSGAEEARSAAKAALGEQRAQPRPRSYAFLPLPAALGALAAACFLPAARPVRYALFGVCAMLLIVFVFLFRRERTAKRSYDARLAALEQADRKAEATVTALEASYQEQLRIALEGLPCADAAHALAYIDEKLARYTLLSQLEREAQEKRLRSELLSAQPLPDAPPEPLKRPEQPPEALRAELDRLAARRAELQRSLAVADGRMRAIGDAAALEASLQEKRAQFARLSEEYDALALALEALERANTEIAGRFSPELGKRTAERFAALTGGRYVQVRLDRAFNALIAANGESVSHDAALLSQGASDQLYLAVRLAICDMVLPADVSVPLVLDDALVSFDDARCAAALELLLRESERRQILLLTCQSREAEYLRGRGSVAVHTL